MKKLSGEEKEAIRSGQWYVRIKESKPDPDYEKGGRYWTEVVVLSEELRIDFSDCEAEVKAGDGYDGDTIHYITKPQAIEIIKGLQVAFGLEGLGNEKG